MNLEFEKKYLGGYREIKKELNVDLIDFIGMNAADKVATQSLDPSTQVGAILIKDGVIISVGYNRPPEKWDKEKFPWGRDIEKVGRENTKYPYIIHAELDAISRCKTSVEGATLYVTLFPCSECAKILSAFKIKEVVYKDIRDDIDSICSKRTLRNSGIDYRKYGSIKLRFDKVLVKK